MAARVDRTFPPDPNAGRHQLGGGFYFVHLVSVAALALIGPLGAIAGVISLQVGTVLAAVTVSAAAVGRTSRRTPRPRVQQPPLAPLGGKVILSRAVEGSIVPSPSGGSLPNVDQVHPDDRPTVRDRRRRAASGEATDASYRLIDRSGRHRWVFERLRPQPTQRGEYIVHGLLLESSGRSRPSSDHLSAAVANLDEALFSLQFDPAGRPTPVFATPRLAGLVDREAEPGGVFDQFLSGLGEDASHRLFRELASATSRIDLVLRVALDPGDRYLAVRGARRTRANRHIVDAIVSDVTDLRRAADVLAVERDRAEERSRRDELTGASNRRAFTEAVDDALARARGRGDGFGVLLVDLDNFKRVNDVHGHVVGDAVLRELVARLHLTLRRGDVVARWGGEEFAVLAAHATDADAVAAVGETIREAVGAAPFSIGDSQLRVTTSVGGAAWSVALDSGEALVVAADEALYRAKTAGRNRVCLAAPADENDSEAIQVARALADTASAREGVSFEHHVEVGEVAAAIAQEVGMPPRGVLRCRLAGVLHDVGKATIPVRVLRKQSPLDEEEWELIRTHAAVGQLLVERTPGLAEAGAAVGTHHERYDGSGYPLGLQSDSIPLEGRIVAAADVWCAMRTLRPHRAPLAEDEARAELRRMAGAQLDPVIVAALERVLDRDVRRSDAA